MTGREERIGVAFGNTLSAKSVRSFLSFKSSFEVILNAYSSNFFLKNRVIGM